MDLDSLPDCVVQHILSKLSNADDVASCNCVCKKWKHSMSYRKSLCFPRGVFENLTGAQTPDSIVMQMVSSASQLEKLVVCCPFTDAGLASWLLAVGSSLKKLELRFTANKHCRAEVECLGAARNLTSLRLLRVVITRSPKWDVFQKLQKLEIYETEMEDSGFMEALRATPNLTRLVVSHCRGLSTICIELLELQHCKFDVYGINDRSLTLKAPKIEFLKVGGCNCIRVDTVNCLKTLSINTWHYNVAKVELGDNLMALESLCVKGDKWGTDLMSKILQLATQVKHLRVEAAVPFPEIDFVDFFKSHPKLKSFYICGGIIDALCNNHMTSIKNVDSSFVIPCLEEVVISLSEKHTLNAKNKSRMIESLLKYGNKLKNININVWTSPSKDDCAVDFSKDIHRTDMDSLPDGVVRHILSRVSNAKDVAFCNYVSNKWKHKSLCFPSGIFENLTGPQTPDSIVMKMVSSVSQLEELVVSCPFTDTGLAAWLLVVGSSLKKLELHFTADGSPRTGLECLGAAKNLRNWRNFIEIHGARLEDSGFTEALRGTPNLTRLVVTRCRGLFTVCIELLELGHCEYHVENSSSPSLTLKAPKIQHLKVDGCNCIRVENASCLKTLSIDTGGSNVTMVELGDNLMALESLCFRDYGSPSDVISKILQLATQVKHLQVGDFWINHEVVPFPEIDFVDFFKSHPKLESLDIRGGIIDAICNNHMTSIKNVAISSKSKLYTGLASAKKLRVDSSFLIPCLEEVTTALTEKQTSNAKKKSRMIESLLKYGNKLKNINIKISTHNMDDDGAFDFSKEIQRLKSLFVFLIVY
ncbi:hypothetical protein OSB04_030196 [Centaurea solstitialis]|uniref:F-box domain-containing protein n=1 Tax=Centaurea solstitialis TaxID=347529 RepID=A0AA38S7Z4_9ASTR|nr:hypothetical protein OSB04_030196 [Centaurea solstitialis]